MTITVSDGTTTVQLNPALLWDDEFTYVPVAQAVTRTLTGAAVVMTSGMSGGQPITLRPEADDSGWTTAAALAQMRNWAAVPGKLLTLTLRGVAHQVLMRHQDKALDPVLPIVHYEDVQDGDFFLVTYRFMKV